MPAQNPMILPRVVMPVFHAEPLKEGGWKLLPSMIYGSCFSIGENYLLTARHVAETVEQTDRKLAVGAYNPVTKLFTGLLVEDYEKLPHDIALLRVAASPNVATPWCEVLCWRGKELLGFDDARCFGYAYGVRRIEDREIVNHRCFDGIVSAHLSNFLPLGMDGTAEKPFPVYELSFQAPRGLSGSPLLYPVNDLLVCGLVFGNSEHQMVVFHSKEVEEEGNVRSSYERWEGLTLGLAVTQTAIFQLKSTMLEGCIGDYLERHSRIAR
jgi:hypothetical protein